MKQSLLFFIFIVHFLFNVFFFSSLSGWKRAKLYQNAQVVAIIQIICLKWVSERFFGQNLLLFVKKNTGCLAESPAGKFLLLLFDIKFLLSRVFNVLCFWTKKTKKKRLRQIRVELSNKAFLFVLLCFIVLFFILFSVTKTLFRISVFISLLPKWKDERKNSRNTEQG